MLILIAKNFMQLLIISAQIRQFALTCNLARLLSLSLCFLSCVLRARFHNKYIYNKYIYMYSIWIRFFQFTVLHGLYACSRSLFGRNVVFCSQRFNCSINDLIYGRLPIVGCTMLAEAYGLLKAYSLIVHTSTLLLEQYIYLLWHRTDMYKSATNKNKQKYL